MNQLLYNCHIQWLNHSYHNYSCHIQKVDHLHHNLSNPKDALSMSHLSLQLLSLSTAISGIAIRIIYTYASHIKGWTTTKFVTFTKWTNCFTTVTSKCWTIHIITIPVTSQMWTTSITTYQIQKMHYSSNTYPCHIERWTTHVETFSATSKRSIQPHLSYLQSKSHTTLLFMYC